MTPSFSAIVAVIAILLWAPSAWTGQAVPVPNRGLPSLPAPIWVYNNWSSYDELSDNVPLTEDLAMRELREILRLRKLGVAFDYYMMDAFWFDPKGGYRRWRESTWPDGPDRWFKALAKAGIKPGLWFGSNHLVSIEPIPAWRDSLNAEGTVMSLSRGGFLADLMDTFEYWYGLGVRAYKLDFVDLDAATPEQQKTETPVQIRAGNIAALRAALSAFRKHHPDVVLVAFNGFGGEMESTATPFPFQRDPIDPAWLEIFDTLYAGDPRASDVPEMDFWRSMDIYSDHMVRRFEQSGIPLSRIDSTGAMVGNTGTNYRRQANAWQGMLLLLAARGGWVNVVHGNLEYIDEDAARWLAKVQRLYGPLQQSGIIRSFGGIPGDVEPYGYAAEYDGSSLYLAVNPTQTVVNLELPLLSPRQSPLRDGRIQFRDAGFRPQLDGDRIVLGPGQLALIGYGKYAEPADDLGIQYDIRIPRAIQPLTANFVADENKVASETVVAPPPGWDIRVVMQQRWTDNNVVRSNSRESMGEYFTITATQNGKDVPVEVRYDKVIWSGLSWAVGEIRHFDLAPNEPLKIKLFSAEPDAKVRIEAKIYQVEY